MVGLPTLTCPLGQGPILLQNLFHHALSILKFRGQPFANHNDQQGLIGYRISPILANLHAGLNNAPPKGEGNRQAQKPERERPLRHRLEGPGRALNKNRNFRNKPLTSVQCVRRMGNCSASYTAFRVSAGKISEADKRSLKRKLSNLPQLGDPAIGGRQSSLTIELSMPRQTD